MAKVKEIIGGYTVPGGRGGAAVAYACQLVLQNPGIKQVHVLERAAMWAGLNISTAGWITSPGPKSPAAILWERRKEGRGFRCYPNDLTDKLGDPRIRLQADIIKEFDKDWKRAGCPVGGDLVRVARTRWNAESPQEYMPGMMLGFVKSTWNNDGKLNLFGRDHLDDVNSYTDGTFQMTPYLTLPNGTRWINMYDITKES